MREYCSSPQGPGRQRKTNLSYGAGRTAVTTAAFAGGCGRGRKSNTASAIQGMKETAPHVRSIRREKRPVVRAESGCSVLMLLGIYDGQSQCRWETSLTDFRR